MANAVRATTEIPVSSPSFEWTILLVVLALDGDNLVCVDGLFVIGPGGYINLEQSIVCLNDIESIVSTADPGVGA